MFYIYAVYNKRNNKIYIGQTKNLEERLDLTRRKIFKTAYTAMFDGEWELIYKEEVQTRAEALEREKQLKSYRGRQFIKKYIPL
ncbi:hypothetical protein A2773_03275 [Candidatus Gottesmanbacteria bacterium RIFCSPHIGHO2_01_FULL_39_10]|uniref:GIY-YIG domain-containing protein n=1 Tax=Candidatus Gottesmanbacteria bacterium RIFCSPHIGHO2_01_FULL_39_10 TaxID=1798375 RepID=A0A1F5ZM46_9BACT|nr:MAG: hypothetical protein A2773_03275 [Candidatus Gottesmanbacteria bacterium RIFCSPHIGHO2_01_FULL_39_10]